MVAIDIDCKYLGLKFLRLILSLRSFLLGHIDEVRYDDAFFHLHLMLVKNCVLAQYVILDLLAALLLLATFNQGCKSFDLALADLLCISGALHQNMSADCAIFVEEDLSEANEHASGILFSTKIPVNELCHGSFIASTTKQLLCLLDQLVGKIKHLARSL